MSLRKAKAAVAAARAARKVREAAKDAAAHARDAADRVREAAGLPREDGQRIDPGMAKETDDPAENVKQGLGLLWKAAKKVARDVKKDVTVASVSHTLEDAGREIARAATNVAEKVGEEIEKIRPKDPDYVHPDDERMKPPYEREAPGDEDEREDRPAPKPKGPTRSDPGFRIAIDDDDRKKK